ncbi:hypothetical protein C0995_002281 [Termitomyces sp. Mi166|nr:hypothetical protein C0995_002281 [Termitomyces sp. Mi166\
MALPLLFLNGMGGGRFQKMIIIVHLWKHMAAHGPLPPVSTATNIASMELLVVAATTVSGLSVPPGPVPAS